MWDTELVDHYVVHPLDADVKLHTHWTTARQHREGVHLTIGPCSYTYRPEQVEVIWNKAMYNSRVDQMKPCAHCWGQITTPEGWNTPSELPATDDDDSDISKRDSTDDEPDTDEEVYRMPQPHTFTEADDDIPNGEPPPHDDDAMEEDG